MTTRFLLFLIIAILTLSGFIQLNDEYKPTWKPGIIIDKKGDTLRGEIDIYVQGGYIHAQLKREKKKKPKDFRARKMRAVILDEGNTYRRFKYWNNVMLRKQKDGYLEFYERKYTISVYSHQTEHNGVTTKYYTKQKLHRWGVYHTERDETIQLSGPNWKDRLLEIIQDNQEIHKQLTEDAFVSDSLSVYDKVNYIVDEYNKGR